EVQRVSTIMGVSSAEGHAWVDAAELSGVSANAFTQAARVMNTQVASGGKALQAMGISMRDAGGDIKSTGDLIEESITKLESYSASAERNALAQKTLGRAWIDLVANGNELLAMVDRTKEEFAGAGSAENTLVAQTKQLQAANAEMKISWDAIVQSAGPALIHIMRSVADSVGYVTAAALEAAAAIQSMFTMASHAGDVASGIGKMLAGGGSENPLTDPSASESIKAGWDQITGAVKAAGDEANKFSDKAKEIDDRFLQQRERIWNPPGITGVSPGTQPGAAPAPAMPGKGGGGGRGGGGGGADPLEAMQNKLADIQPEMDKLNQEFSKMGSEATMAAKASSDSFDTLKARATQDWTVMTGDYKRFTDALKAGNADAAKSAEQDWHTATQKFQQDWDAAKAKAQQDMQQIKSTADQISGEISGVLNSAISGKLNWQQEFTKILEKMLDAMIKYCTQMVVRWAVAEEQKIAVTTSGEAEGLAVQKAANTQAGFSDAVTAAKGAYSSASQIPYIGWILGPAAAAAAFAGVEAFGSAAGGAVIPPGTNPRLQLHENEMVLPSGISRGMQEMIRGGGYGGGGNTANINMHMQSLDPRTMSDIMMGSHDMITSVVARGIRGGMTPYTG